MGTGVRYTQTAHDFHSRSQQTGYMATYTALLGGEAAPQCQSKSSNVWKFAVLAVCASAALVLSTNRSAVHDTAASPKVFAVTPQMQVVQAFWGAFLSGKFDAEEKHCVATTNELFAEHVVADWTGNPCDYFDGVHKGVSGMCSLFKNIRAHIRLSKTPDIQSFQDGNVVLQQVHAEYVTIPAGKQLFHDEIIVVKVVDGKVASFDLYINHGKKLCL